MERRRFGPTNLAVLSWRLSNFDVPDLREERATADYTAPVCNQVLYHLQERAADRALISATCSGLIALAIENRNGLRTRNWARPGEALHRAADSFLAVNDRLPCTGREIFGVQTYI